MIGSQLNLSLGFVCASSFACRPPLTGVEGPSLWGDAQTQPGPDSTQSGISTASGVIFVRAIFAALLGRD
jgi:hypothetical protein